MKVGQNKEGGRQKNFKDNTSFNEKKKNLEGKAKKKNLDIFASSSEKNLEGKAKKILDIFYTN